MDSLKSILEQPQIHTGGVQTLKTAQLWLERRRGSHSACEAGTNPSWRPSRLVTFSLGLDGCLSASLHESSSNDFDAGVKYMALSHQWLAEDVTKLTTENILQLRHSVPQHQLKASIRDAMKIAL